MKIQLSWCLALSFTGPLLTTILHQQDIIHWTILIPGIASLSFFWYTISSTTLCALANVCNRFTIAIIINMPDDTRSPAIRVRRRQEHRKGK